MKKKVGIIKRNISILLIFLLSINSFAAIVSDNDGSAFVTKAEFDALKTSFNKQIDDYNESIDGKIDGAIASYLSGINVSKVSTERFFDGKGSKVLVCTTANINNIVRGKGKIDYNLLVSNFNTAYYWEMSVLMLQMKRDSEKNFEMFMVDNGHIRYMKEVELAYQTTAACVQYGGGQFDSTPSQPFRLRWHASPWSRYNDTSRRPQYKRLKEPQSWLFWSDRLDDFAYYDFYGTMWNFGWQSNNADKNYGSVTANVTYEPKSEEIGIIFDNSKTNATIWVNGPQIAASDVVARLDEIDGLNHYDNTTTSTFQVKYSTPTLAGIVTTAKGRDKYYAYAGAEVTDHFPWPLLSFDSVQWVDYGDFNHIDNTGCSYPQYITNGWYEPAPALRAYSPKTLKQNIDANIISEYAPYGYTGNLVEGVPIGVFEKNCEVEFEIDTTPIGSSVCMAFSKTPFDPNTTDIENSPAIENVDISVDGVSWSTGHKVVTAGTHKIKMKINASSSNKLPIFFKICWATSYTGTKRAAFNLPTEYKLSIID